jgi:hypothetical protein
MKLLLYRAAVVAAAALVAAELTTPPPQAAASRWSGFWPASAPPAHVPSSEAVDGPLLGNGDVGLVAGVNLKPWVISLVIQRPLVIFCMKHHWRNTIRGV